jgi:hypothetical protein
MSKTLKHSRPKSTETEEDFSTVLAKHKHALEKVAAVQATGDEAAVSAALGAEEKAARALAEVATAAMRTSLRRRLSSWIAKTSGRTTGKLMARLLSPWPSTLRGARRHSTFAAPISTWRARSRMLRGSRILPWSQFRLFLTRRGRTKSTRIGPLSYRTRRSTDCTSWPGMCLRWPSRCGSATLRFSIKRAPLTPDRAPAHTIDRPSGRLGGRFTFVGVCATLAQRFGV